jgi:hypothetical protein
LHPLLRKLKVASLRLARQSKAALLRLAARPRSLERLLLFTTAGLLLFSIAVISLASLGLLREQASAQALARVRAAAHQTRYEIRRVGEDTVTAARLLASRPTLARLVQEGNSCCGASVRRPASIPACSFMARTWSPAPACRYPRHRSSKPPRSRARVS